MGDDESGSRLGAAVAVAVMVVATAAEGGDSVG